MEIGRRIFDLRKHLGLNQSDFGKRIGVTRSAVCNYENGSRSIGEQVILAICREFNVSETWLRTGSGDMQTQQPREAELTAMVNNFGMGLTLREGNREYFYKQLDRLFPGLKEKYSKTYGYRYEIASPRNSCLLKRFHQLCEEYGMVHNNDAIFSYLHAFEEKGDGRQMSLWD